MSIYSFHKDTDHKIWTIKNNDQNHGSLVKIRHPLTCKDLLMRNFDIKTVQIRQ